ncbi:hypothetical protein MTR67_033132 [Solanum verrucosum]|uniref:Pentatricopeptide repeat-containing protein n=1 Tax=Solanum verrucosum TaxID=315347 RepID=A0AAF0U5S3_SOLVR|nr:hypothetical protein MTR67_033132 [Solanum verrucosum]
MYGKCGYVKEEEQLFDEMPKRNVVSWNALISGYLDTHYPENAIMLFLVSLLSAYSGCSCSVEDFHKLCSDIVKWDEISWNAIISGFSNFGVAGEAFFYFSRMRRAGFTALQN